MTDEFVPTGPACDFCTDWPAVGTLMNLADYATQRFCASCGPAFLLGIVEAMTGMDAAAPEPDAAEHPTAAVAESIPATASSTPGAIDGDDGQGSAADHWASTKNVVRSTHGHRGGRAAGKDDAE